jgi:putative ubiquitin-RnfH superfamily antitoxin RatB of RatAB toxin-antitoxin module
MVNRRILTCLFLVMISSLIGVAQPRLLMQSVVDWGMVTPRGSLTKQQTVQYRVPIKNVGDKTLVITSVRPQCGCTTAPLERDTLMPGEETGMNITLTLPAGSGVIDKYVTVYSNDSAGAHVVKLRAEVQRPLQLSSSFLGFNQGRVGEPTRSKISLTSFVDDPVTLTLQPLTSGLTVIGPASVVAQKNVPMPIEVEFTPVKAGVFNVQMKITTTLADYDTIEITGYGIADAAKK